MPVLQGRSHQYQAAPKQLQIEGKRSRMGRKYDAYQAAAQAEGIAKNRYSDVQGGSTKEAMTEATNNAIQAERNSNLEWQEFIEDPEG